MRVWILMMLSATLALGQAKPPDTLARCRGILSDAVQDHNPDIRKNAAEALSLVGLKDNALESLNPHAQRPRRPRPDCGYYHPG